MSITQSTVRYLSWLHARHELKGPALTLGRQVVFCAYSDVIETVERQIGFSHAKSAQQPTGQVIDSLKAVHPYSGYTNDRAVFEVIAGIESLAIDISGYQGADIICDLTKRLPDNMNEKFGLVFDGGTLEHVFDVPKALRNITRVLTCGGRVIHLVPTSGYTDHGYYQISPSLLFEFYESNGFDNAECLLVKIPKNRANHSQWTFWHWCRGIRRKRLVCDETLAIAFSAEKTRNTDYRAPHDAFSISHYQSESKAFEAEPWGLDEVAELRPWRHGGVDE